MNTESLTIDTQTDGAGRYVLHLQPGTWTLTFRLTGFRQHREDVVIAAPPSASELNVRLSRTGPVEMVTTHGPKGPYQMYTVQGVVRGDDGAGLHEAITRLRASRPSRFVVATEACTSDDDGRYTIVAWSTKPIRWRLSVEAENYRPFELRDLDLIAGEVKTLDIRLDRR